MAAKNIVKSPVRAFKKCVILCDIIYNVSIYLQVCNIFQAMAYVMSSGQNWLCNYLICGKHM